MFLRLLLVLTLALAGCSGKSAQSTIPDADEAASAAASQAPLGPGRLSPAPAPSSTAGPSPSPPDNGGAEPRGPSSGAANTEDPVASGQPPAPASSPATQGPTSSSPVSPIPSPSGVDPPATPELPSAPSLSTPPPLPAPAPVTASCTVALPGPSALGGLQATAGSCSPTTFVSSTGAAFTQVTVHVVQSAKALPAAVLVQVKDASGTVIGTATGLGPLQVSIPAALVPGGPSVGLAAEVLPTGVFQDYVATLTFTLG